MLNPKVTTVPVDTAHIAGDLTFLSGTIMLKINGVTEGTYGLITVLATTFEFDRQEYACWKSVARFHPPPCVASVLVSGSFLTPLNDWYGCRSRGALLPARLPCYSVLFTPLMTSDTQNSFLFPRL